MNFNCQDRLELSESNSIYGNQTLKDLVELQILSKTNEQVTKMGTYILGKIIKLSQKN